MGEQVGYFSLCTYCRERQGKTALALLPPARADEECYVCRGISGDLSAISAKVVSHLKRFEFKTFSIGLVLPPGIQEREDTLRSEMKIRGGETIKSELAGRIAEAVLKGVRGGRRIDRLHPDATVLVGLGDQSVAITSKPLFLHCRYTKPREVAQRMLFCDACGGRGCDACEGTGYSRVPSVEETVSKKLGSLLGSNKFKFTWFGSEDPDSLVFPPGRPMVVESKSPMRRRLPRTLRLNTGRGSVVVTGIRVVSKFEHPTFVFMTRIVMVSETAVSGDALTRFQREMKNSSVRYRNNKGKLVDKKIYFVRATSRGRRIVADVKLDGGLPVKRLVSGDAVSPSFSQTLGMQLRCERFDIVRVWPKHVD